MTEPVPANSPNPTLRLPRITSENAQRLSARFVFRHGWMNALAWSADGQWLALSTAAGVVIYAMTALNQPHLLKAHTEPVRTLGFHRDGDVLYSSGDDGRLMGWHLPDFAAQEVFRLPDVVNGLALHSAGDVIALGDKRGQVTLFSIQANQPTQRLSHPTEVTAVAFSPDGETLLTSAEGAVYYWTHTPGLGFTLRETIQAHAGKLTQISFSLDGQWIATSSRDGMCRVWQASPWKLHLTLSGHAAIVDRVDFSPDGRLLASAGRDHTIRLWETSTGAGIATLGGHQKPVMALGFNPQGTVLASAGGEHVGVLWGVQPVPGQAD